jgi:ABC-2 type transport system ATP-binding protein/ribosome-dependent ATPase
MADGVLVAQGSEADVVGGTTAAEVACDDWAAAFSALAATGAPVMLAGRTVRVADGDPDALRAALADAGLTGEVRVVPATIEERMAVLARR